MTTTASWIQSVGSPVTPDACMGVIMDHALRGDTLTADQWDDLACRAGRVHAPALLYAAWEGGVIADDVVAEVIGSVWAMAEYPDRSLARAEWRELFDAAGYTVDGHRSPRPAEPLVLWRGSVPERALDWSWSASREVAERYAAGRVAGRQPGRLYRAVVPPEALLCSNAGHDRGEAEYVVDTALVDAITDAGAA